MAIALVQSVSKVTSPQANNTTLAYTSNVTAGNLLCVSHVHFIEPDQAITTPTDSLGHTYTGMVTTQTFANPPFGTGRLNSYYVPNATAGANTVSFDIGGTGAGDLTVVVAEFSGIVTSSPLDVTTSNTGTGTSINTGTTSTTGQADELLWAVMTHGGGTDITITETGTATLIEENEGGAQDMPISVTYRILNSIATYAATWTIGGSNPWLAHAATFKAASSAPRRCIPGHH